MLGDVAWTLDGLIGGSVVARDRTAGIAEFKPSTDVERPRTRPSGQSRRSRTVPAMVPGWSTSRASQQGERSLSPHSHLGSSEGSDRTEDRLEGSADGEQAEFVEAARRELLCASDLLPWGTQREMPEYSLALALQDFVPVALAAVGWVYVVRVVSRADPGAGRLALVGATAVVAGGTSRAVWKAVVALDGPDVAVLFAALYPLLAFGFLALAGALLAVSLGRAPGRVARAVPIVAVALLALASVLLGPGTGRLVPVMWLAVATLGSVTVGMLLAGLARRAGHPGVATLFVVGVVATVVLNGLARSADQSEPVQWIYQSLNTLNQLVFLLASWRLWLVQRANALDADRDNADRSGRALDRTPQSGTQPPLGSSS